MVKKKSRVKPVKRVKKRKTAKKNHPFLSSLKQFAGIVFAGTAISIALLLVHDYAYPEETESAYSKIRSENTAGKSSKEPLTALKFPKGAEQPRLLTDVKQQILYREGYTVSYNPEYRIPNWVAWVLTKEEAESDKVPRNDRFVPDPEVSEWATASDEDYRNSGFDRGHMAPAADMKWSHKAMRESFYFSNICPQNQKMNSGIWNTLERKSRTWASDKEAVYIVSGPVIKGNLRHLGKNRVAVPEQFYKVICTVSNNKYRGIAFLLENREYRNTPLQTVAIPIDSIEAITGIDFFPLLPDGQEEEMERSVDPVFWF
jgi:endonuclease G